MLTLVSGGSASGKSEFAESLVTSSACEKRYYLATMIPYDDECRQRIKRHRQMRAQKGFDTIEVPMALEQVCFPSGSPSERCALLECMSNLVANELFSPDGAHEDCERAVLSGIERLVQQCGEVVIVTNELFSDGVRYDEGTEEYLRLLGRLNQAIAARADNVYEVVAGIALCLKGEDKR